MKPRPRCCRRRCARPCCAERRSVFPRRARRGLRRLLRPHQERRDRALPGRSVGLGAARIFRDVLKAAHSRSRTRAPIIVTISPARDYGNGPEFADEKAFSIAIGAILVVAIAHGHLRVPGRARRPAGAKHAEYCEHTGGRPRRPRRCTGVTGARHHAAGDDETHNRTNRATTTRQGLGNDEKEDRRKEMSPAAGDRQIDRKRHRAQALSQFGTARISAVRSVRERRGLPDQLARTSPLVMGPRP